MTLRVLGIDPGTAVTGYGVLEPASGKRPAQLVECGVIRTNPNDEMSRRIAAVFEGVTELIERHRPSVLALASVFYGKNVHTTVTLGHVRGVILLAAAQAELDVAEFAPATVKKNVVGAGGASKSQVGYMVQRLLNLEAPPAPNDAADGVAIGLTYLLTRRVPA